MPILNYTTKIDDHKTVSEIQAILSRKGASSVMVIYENGNPEAVSFQFAVGGTDAAFKLPCKFAGVRKVLLADIKGAVARNRRERDKEFDKQVRRVAWRIVKDWVEAQLALIAAGHAEIGEVFLPYLVAANGQTLFEAFRADAPRLLRAISQPMLALGDGQ